MWCWRRLLRVPWTARRSNQSILKEINSEYCLEGLMLKLKLHYFGHLMWRANLLEKTLMLGKIESKRRRGGKGEMVRQHHWLNRCEFEQTLGDSEGKGIWVRCSPWGHKGLNTAEWLNSSNNNLEEEQVTGISLPSHCLLHWLSPAFLGPFWTTYYGKTRIK